MSGNVKVAGVGMIPFGRYPEQHVAQLGAEAALAALDDAGVEIKDMNALFCGNAWAASEMVGQKILRQIGQTGIPVVNTANACASGGTALRLAVTAIKAGSREPVYVKTRITDSMTSLQSSGLSA